MSSPKSATPVPPPAKKRGVWSSDDKMVLSCVKGSSASPKHTIFTVLRTVIPHVQVRKIQPPEECGLISGHKSLDSKQTIKKVSVASRVIAKGTGTQKQNKKQ